MRRSKVSMVMKTRLAYLAACMALVFSLTLSMFPSSAALARSGDHEDHTAPTTSISADTSKWYNSAVSVTLSAEDSGSGVDWTRYKIGSGSYTYGTSFSVPSDKGSSVTVYYYSKDNAGNQEVEKSATFKFDTQDPEISVDRYSVSPNDDHWFKTDVTVYWDCHDHGGSGLADGTCAATTVTTEGSDVHATGNVRDNAGNTSSATKHLKIDKTAPSLRYTLDPATANANGWYKTDVTVDWTCRDSLSGLDGECPHDKTFRTDGVNQGDSKTIKDHAGNSTNVKVEGINIDKTKPTISFKKFSTDANANGWYNGDVIATWNCADATSGVDTCADTTITGEGVDLSTGGSVTDKAGNSDTATSDKVKIDRTKPVMTYTLTPAQPTSNGWYKANVSVKWECSDALSGLEANACPADETLSTEKLALSVTRTVTDKAGNTTEVTTDPINLDKTSPLLSGTLATNANADGWYNGDVKVNWTCSDALSGIMQVNLPGGCPLPQGTITGEGRNLTTSATISDRAGNSTNTTSPSANIDRAAPSSSARLPYTDNGWYHGGVNIDFSANDSLSGVAATYYKFETDNDYQLFTGSFNYAFNGSHTLSFYSVDKAGNAESPSSTSVKIDESHPYIKAVIEYPNNGGWYTEPVKVIFICEDTVSGITFCPAPVILDRDGADQEVSGTATNGAGLTSKATLGGIDIDMGTPLVKILELASNAVYKLGAIPTPSYTAEDGVSGIDTSFPVQTWYYGGTANGVGTISYHVTVHDNAGNPGTSQVQFKVEYNFGSFVEISGAAGRTDSNNVNVYKVGSPLTIKFQLLNADGSVTQIKDASLIKWLSPLRGSQLGTTPGGFGSASATDAWGWEDGKLVYRWTTTDDMAGSYWQIGVALDDGQVVNLVIGLE